MNSFSEVSEVKFELPYVLTWVVKEDRHPGYSIPIVLDDENALRIEELSHWNGTRSPLYPLYDNSNALYLRVPNLSPKQKKELLNKGESHILIHFTLKGINTANNSVKHLSFKVTKLRKVEESDDDSCPED